MPTKAEFVTAAQTAGAVLKRYASAIPTSNASKIEAINTLKNSECAGTAAFTAALRALGAQFLAWEPESIWLELEAMGVALSLENRDKVLAASTLVTAPHFYWDASVFENTVLAFNSMPSMPDAIQEASPNQIAWGVFEAELICQYYAKHDFVYDYEPERYVATVLHRAGFLLAPELLVFAQDELDKLNVGNKDIQEAVKNRWEKIDHPALEHLELTESPEDVQIGRLAAVHLYLDEKLRQLNREIPLLK